MEQQPKDMDIHYKNGVIRCKYCRKEVKTPWPLTLQNVLDGDVYNAIEEFKLAHTQCALHAKGYTS